MERTGTILDKIIRAKQLEVETLRRDAAGWKARACDAPPTLDFPAALENAPHVPIIAEIKRASPSTGLIQPRVDAAEQARLYQAGGAAALSVLTDGPFFGGALEDLARAKRAAGKPVLRKDFIVDSVQLHQSRAAGADAVLLVAAALGPARLAELFAEALELSLTPLVEVHDELELAWARPLRPRLLGLNNRDLATLAVSLETSLRLRPLVGDGALVVAESGITGPEDVRRLRAGGLDAFLVGTALMRADDPTVFLRSLCHSDGGG
ncbi:MAG: indole-3-glycerol phosphate synthase TrpC [Thermodesulfobacteriota bacterium]